MTIRRRIGFLLSVCLSFGANAKVILNTNFEHEIKTYYADVFPNHVLIQKRGYEFLSYEMSGNQITHTDMMNNSLERYLSEPFKQAFTVKRKAFVQALEKGSQDNEYLKPDKAALGLVTLDTVSEVTEPASLSLIGIGLLGLVLARRKHKNLEIESEEVMVSNSAFGLDVTQ